MQKYLNKLTIPVMITIILFFVKIMFPALYDNDFFWHLKTGEYIFTTQSLPQFDIFSHTFTGKKWVLHEWLTQFIIYLTKHYFGLIGIKVLVAGLIAATYYLVFKTARVLTEDDTQAVIISLMFFAPNVIFAIPRPQMFSYFFFAACLLVLVEFKYRRVTKRFFLLPIIMLFWANLHGAFIVGIGLLVLFTACEWLNFWLTKKTDAQERRDLYRLSYFILASALITAVNPEFIAYWLYPFQVLSMDAAKTLIMEWQSPDFHAIYNKYYFLLGIAFFAAAVYRAKKPDLTEMIIPIFFFVAALTSGRHLPFACLAAVPFFASHYANRTKRAQLVDGQPSVVSGSNLATRQIDHVVPALNLAMLVVVAATVIFVEHSRQDSDPIAKLMPSQAADFVIKNGISGNLFNSYDDGGYLIYRLAPERKVFIDGRADLYGDVFLKEFINIHNGTADWREKFDKYAIDYLICKKDAPIRQLLLEGNAFRLVHNDEWNSVLVRNIPRFDGLPTKSAK